MAKNEIANRERLNIGKETALQMGFTLNSMQANPVPGNGSNDHPLAAKFGNRSRGKVKLLAG